LKASSTKLRLPRITPAAIDVLLALVRSGRVRGSTGGPLFLDAVHGGVIEES
jgi:hypothetical protein